jgi:hypothetical protein
LPYLVAKARYEVLNRQRKAFQRHEISSGSLPDVATQSFEDAYVDWVIADSALRRVLEAVSQLSDEDVIILWRHVEGMSDQQIRDRWASWRLPTPAPSIAALRKRRERIRNRLRLEVEGDDA